MKGFSENLARLAALAILVGLLAGVWFFIINPVIQTKSALTADLQSTQAEKNHLTAAIANLAFRLENGDAADLQGEIWQAKQAGEMTARIQAELGAIAHANGITLRSVTPARAPRMPLVDTTALRIEAEADLAQFRALIITIEQHSPALFIERATIRRLNRPGRISEQPLVFFQLDIAAPIRIGGE